MAIKAFTRKQTLPSSDEYFQKIDDLLKRRRAGGVVTGYDTASNMAINLGGKILNPTGMVDKPASKEKEITYSPIDYSTVNPAEVSISELSPEELTAFYSNPYIDEETKGLIEQTLNELYSPETAEVLNDANETGNQVTETINQIEQDRQTDLESQSPISQQDIQSGKVSKQGSRYTGDAATTDEQLNQLPEELRLIAKVQRDNARFLQDAPKEYKQIFEEQQKQLQKDKESAQRLAPKLVDIKAKEAGLTVEQLNQNNDLELSLPEGWEKTEDGGMKKIQKETKRDYRGEVGDAVDVLASFLRLPETGLSELIAGRNTKNTIAANAVEPLQAGEGIDQIQKEFQAGAQSIQPSQFRPALENISGFNPMIGNVAGIQGENAITGSKAPSQFSGTAIVPASVARIAEGGLPISQNIGVGSNQPSNNRQSNNQSSNNNQSSSVSNVFKPVATNKTVSKMTYTPPKVSGVNTANISSKTIPVSSNLGVGSNQPSQPKSQPKQGIVSSVVNVIKNLFKRK